MKNRTQCNQALAQAMDERQEQLDIIHDAKSRIHRIEEGIKEELIAQRRTHCLKVDWARVRTTIRR